MDNMMMKALSNWRDFNVLLSSLSESQLKEMLKYELENESRKSFVERLHQRYNTLRVSREREILMKDFE